MFNFCYVIVNNRYHEIILIMSSSTEKEINTLYLVTFEECHYDPKQIQIFYNKEEAEIYRLILIAKFRNKHDVAVIEKKIVKSVGNVEVKFNS